MPETRRRLTDEELDTLYRGQAVSYILAEAQLRKIALVLKGEAHLDIDGQGVGLAVLPQALLDSLYEEAGLVQKGRDVRT